LLGKAARLGLALEAVVGRGEVEILWQAPTEEIMDALAHRLLGAVRRRGVRRLFVDGLGGFIETAADPGRISSFFAALANELRAQGVTTLYTLETRDLVGSDVLMPVNGISSLVENLLLLRFVEHEARLRRLLTVVKVRDSDHDPRLRELLISDRGIVLTDAFAGAREVLSGYARAARGPGGEVRRPRSSRD
jgi:circadian clock protein KaiC